MESLLQVITHLHEQEAPCKSVTLTTPTFPFAEDLKQKLAKEGNCHQKTPYKPTPQGKFRFFLESFDVENKNACWMDCSAVMNQ